MPGTNYNYTVDVTDRLSGKFSKIATVGSSVYAKLNAGQRMYNANLRQGGTGVNNMLGNIKRLAAGYIGITAGIQLGRNSLMKWDEQMKSDAQLKAALTSTNYAAGKSFNELATQANKLQKKTLFGNEATQQIQALALTFKNIRGDIYDQTIPAILDMSTAMKMDGKSAAIQLGKALNDPKIGLTMLGRSGVTFSESQKKLINSLVDTNQLAKAQAIILREINSEFGGSAEAARKAGLGPWQAFMNAMYDHMEHLGPMLNKGLVKIMELTGWIERNAQMIKLWGTVVATFVAGYYSWIALTKAWSIAMAIYKSVVFINIGLTRGWAVAQRALNITMAANPIGMLIAGVAALGTAIYLLINKLNKANSVYDSIMRNAEENTIRERMELDLLFDALKKTNPESEERKKLLEQIDDKYPGLLKNMKLEKAGLDEISTAYQAIAESIEQKAKMAAAQDMLEQVYKERFKLQNEGPSTWDFALSALSSNPGNAMAGRLSNKFSVLAKKEAELKKLLMGDNSYFTPNSIIDPDPDPDPDPLGGDGIAENITSGGSRPTNITINLGKFQDQIVIHAANVKEGASEMRNIIMEELTRVINSANYSVSQ